jgi:hypothetical protein
MGCWAKSCRALASAAFLLAVAAGPASAATPLSGDAEELRAWVQRSHDHQRMPFAIVDKRHARLHVFDAAGRLAGSSAVLLGATVGDHIVPGVGERAQRGTVRWDERTTPAGRFVSTPGENISGEHVVWVDYDSAFAIHRLRPGRTFKSRELRLASPVLADKRVSAGCVVVPVPFYEQVVQRVLGSGASVVYVMPELRPMRSLFSASWLPG